MKRSIGPTRGIQRRLSLALLAAVLASLARGARAEEPAACSFPTCSCEAGDDACAAEHRRTVQLLLTKDSVLSQDTTCQARAMAAMNSCPKKERRKGGSLGKDGKSQALRCFEANAGQAASECKGMKCGVQESQDIGEQVIAASDEAQKALAALIGQVKQDAAKLKEGEAQARQALEDKAFGCPICGPVGACVDGLKKAVDAIAQGVEEESGNLAKAGAGEGEDVEPGYDAALQAIDVERTLAKEKFPALLEKLLHKDDCLRGVEDKDGGKESRRKFEALVSDQESRQKQLLETVRTGWCERHECKAPDLKRLGVRLGKLGDAANDLSEQMGDVSPALDDALDALQEAGELLAGPKADESRSYVKGVQTAAEAAGLLEEANGMFDDAAASSCGEEPSEAESLVPAETGDHGVKEE